MEKQNIKTEPTKAQSGHFESVLATEIQQIPKKIFFKIGEVAEFLNIKTHILRYWEMEFKSFHPKKTNKGQRLYLKKDIETALLIKKLLYRDKFSIKGAKKVLADLKRENREYHKKKYSESHVLKKVTQIQESISTIRKLIE